MKEKQSPLKKLVSMHEETLPVRVVPKVRVVTPIVEPGDSVDIVPSKNMAITHSSLTLNFNFNLDAKTVDRAMEHSARVAKGLAASAMAMLGTAFIFSGKKGKVKIPRSEKIKVPRIKD